MGVYDPFYPKDFQAFTISQDGADAAAAIANAKFHIVIQNWVPMSLMKMIEVDKNLLEQRLRDLELELTKFKELMGGMGLQKGTSP